MISRQQIAIIEAAFERSLAFTPYNFISNLTGQPVLSLPIYVNKETEASIGNSNSGDLKILKLNY